MSTTDFLSSLTNSLQPFEVAGPGTDTPAASGNPVNNPVGTAPATIAKNLTPDFSGFAAWFEGVIVQIAAILLGLILVAIALIMIAMREGPNIQVAGKVNL